MSLYWQDSGGCIWQVWEATPGSVASADVYGPEWDYCKSENVTVPNVTRLEQPCGGYECGANYEDATTYIEVDPNGHITVENACQVYCTNIANNESAYLVKDVGTGKFGDGFVVEGDITFLTGDGNSDAFAWAVSDAQGAKNIWTHFIGITSRQWSGGAGRGCNVRTHLSLQFLNLTSYIPPGGTVFWKATRNGTSVTVDFYRSWQDRAADVDKIASKTVSVNIDDTFRYLYYVASLGESSGSHIQSFISSMLIQPTTQPPVEDVGQLVRLAADATDIQSHNPQHAGQIVSAVIAGRDICNYLPETALQEVRCASISHDIQRYRDTASLGLLLALDGYDEQLNKEIAAHLLLVVVHGDDFQTFIGQHDGTVVLMALGGSDQTAFAMEACGQLIMVQLGGHDLRSIPEEVLAQYILPIIGARDCQTYRDHEGQSLIISSDQWWMQTFPFLLSVPVEGTRRLAWRAESQPEGTVFLVIADGKVLQETPWRAIDFDQSIECRQFLQVGVPRPDVNPEDWLQTPKDRVALSWTGDTTTYRIMRKGASGDWQQIAETAFLQYLDGPLSDGVYSYKVVAVDEEGDTAESATATLTISSAPKRPMGLGWSWDADTKMLTLAWQASPSADVAAYRVRSSNGEGQLDLASEPVQESGALLYQQTFSDETGVWVFSVRAVDVDGNEEANISQVVALPFEDGAPAACPAEPRLVEAAAIAGGRIELRWLYDPLYEYMGPGAAHEGRIYWDAGTGEIDWSAPHAIVPMNNLTKVTRYTWQSDPLADGQTYRFVIRVATSPWPSGIETSNTDEHAATCDATSPTTPILRAAVV
jgi:hypothetical protein